MQVRMINKPGFWQEGQSQLKRNYLCRPYDLVNYLRNRDISCGRNFVIDLGVGLGANLQCLFGAGKSNVIAVDKEPDLYGNLQSEVGKKAIIDRFESMDLAAASLIDNPFASVAFVQADMTLCQLPTGVADGVVLHRVISIITDPDMRMALLENIRFSLKPGGMFSFLDFLVNRENTPTVIKQYKLGRLLVENQLVYEGPPKSALKNGEASILAILQLEGRTTTTGRADESMEDTFTKIKEGEISVISFATQMTPKGYVDLLSSAGFNILKDKVFKIPALNPAYQVEVIRVLAQRPITDPEIK